MSFKPTLRSSMLAATSLWSLTAQVAYAQDAKSVPTATAPVTTAADGTPADAAPGEIVVTATRQSQAISKVPISISAFSEKQLDTQGVRRIDDLVRLTPGVSFRRTAIGVGGASIRGITSSAGASTIGVYIDDSPVQARNLGTSPSTFYPLVFDLERVEVLRGPQGTLFGAGSEGGTIRFIQPGPSYRDWSVYARGEVATTQNGAESHEAGIAIGGPIVEDKIGFRASVYFRHDGGYIDKVTGYPTVVNATGAAGAASLSFQPTGTYKADANWMNSFSARAALGLKPTETLTITPSITYQHTYTPDATGFFWSSLSDTSSGDFKAPKWVPTVDATHTAINAPSGEPQRDRFVLPSLKIEWNGPGFDVISDTSYFKRDMHEIIDYTSIYEVSYASRKVPSSGDLAISEHWNGQRNFTQEVRLQSSDPTSRLTWVAGGFYQRAKQNFQQYSSTNFLPYLTTMFSATQNGGPFGAGTSAFVNWYGVEPINGVGTYLAQLHTIDKQLAGFADASFELFDGVKLNGGIRVSRHNGTYLANYAGPSANLNAPHGAACPTGTTCVVGQGAYAPSYIHGDSGIKETSVTPKFGASWQIDPHNMVYASASKGFRPGGAQVALPSNCNAELISLGYTDGNGHASSPQTYKSDTVWSYEIGAKNRLGKLQISTSAFLIKWKNIQSNVAVNSCLQSLTDNLGSATSKGFDLQAQIQLFTGLNLSTSVGYNKATFDHDIRTNGILLYSGGSAITGFGAPWTVVVSGDYEHPIGEKTAYVHADYTYTSHYLRTGATDPASTYYDVNLPLLPMTQLVNARAGMRFSGIDLSFFVNNLFNVAPHLGYTHTKNQPIWTDYSFRPRTMGLTASYRY